MPGTFDHKKRSGDKRNWTQSSRHWQIKISLRRSLVFPYQYVCKQNLDKKNLDKKNLDEKNLGKKI